MCFDETVWKSSFPLKGKLVNKTALVSVSCMFDSMVVIFLQDVIYVMQGFIVAIWLQNYFNVVKAVCTYVVHFLYLRIFTRVFWA